jgi:hypothetical protein
MAANKFVLKGPGVEVDYTNRSICTGGATNRGLARRWMRRSGSIRRVKSHTICDTVHEWTETSSVTCPSLFVLLGTGPSWPRRLSLGMSPSAVSHAVRSVEERLGTPLFARTTRSVSVTEAGARFIAGVEPAIVDIGKAIEGLSAERGQVTGLLRINAPRGVLDTLLIPILTRLARQHPRLTVEVTTGAFPADIVAQGFDAGIRIRKRFIQQDMVTTRLTRSVKLILVASRD